MKRIEIKSEGYTYRYDFEPVPSTVRAQLKEIEEVTVSVTSSFLRRVRDFVTSFRHPLHLAGGALAS